MGSLGLSKATALAHSPLVGQISFSVWGLFGVEKRLIDAQEYPGRLAEFVEERHFNSD